jgi:oxygen-independent coproporphyrinogen III oxidase
MAVTVPRSLLEKHNKPGPRYTSYPTVPVWSKDFGSVDYRSALGTVNERPDDDLSIYLHLPFCVKRCFYCGCNSMIAGDKSAVDRYIDRVEREIEMVTDIIGTGRNVVQMHWGGGTPNYLTRAQTERVMAIMGRAFTFDALGEISLEVDPRIGSAEQASWLREAGFNRISLGVQDFNRQVQKAIGRIQSQERTLAFYDACREAGFSEVNLDLVYGLPYQTLESFQNTLEQIIALAPDRVACFSYAHVPWVKPEQEQIDASKLPETYAKFEIFQHTIDQFESADYHWIGLDHFAKASDPLAQALQERRLHRNFMGYTTRPAPHMIAFGMSGIGEVGDCFIQNDANCGTYESGIDAGDFPVVRGHRLNMDDLLRREAILHLMCNLELPFDLTCDAFGDTVDTLLARELDEIRKYEAEGFVEYLSDRIRITDLGRYFIRNVCMEFDAYLDQGNKQPLFSKTI